MLLPEKVKEFLAHPDADVRDAAIYYFEYHHDRSIISADGIWQAVDQIGMEKADRAISSLGYFRQTDESIQRLIKLLQTAPDDKLDRYLDIVAQLDSATIAKHHDAILCNDKVHAQAGKDIQARLAMLKLTSEQLWQSLSEHSQVTQEEWTPAYWNTALYLIDAIVHHNDDTWQKAVEVLKAPRQDNWLEIFAINLLGRVKRLELLDLVMERMELYDDLQSEQITLALTNLDSHSVVEKLASWPSTANNDFKFSAYEILARYPSRQSQLTLMRWVDEEQDVYLKTGIYWAIARHMPTEEDALDKLRAGAIVCRDVRFPIDHIEGTLLTLSKMIGKEFPEADEWRKISEGRKTSRVKQMIDSRAEWEDNYPDEFEPLVSEKIGRNNPCPCGSGKKYKKCCLGKAPLA